MMLAAAALSSAPAAAQDLADAKIVFVGTVEQVGAATFTDVPVSNRTVIVKVEAVMMKPRAMSLFKEGDRITLQLREGALARVGERARFFAANWIAGAEGKLALREIGREPVDTEPTPPGPVTAQQRREVADRQLAARMQRAQAVVVGRVTAVRSAPAPERAAATPPRITEHDPQWKDASIRVSSAIKGASPNQTIVVRFPASNDVVWKDAPKFRVGQSGTFILDKPSTRDPDSGGNVYTAASKDQVLPATEGARLQQLLRNPR